MKKTAAVLTAVIIMLLTGCATADKRATSGQQLLGAVIVTGAVAGGAVAGTNTADANKMSDTQAVLTGAGFSVLAGAAAGFIYDFILNAAGLKEDIPKTVAEENTEQTPDFMLQKR